MIRAAKFGDLPRVAEILREAHERSIYAGLTFDDAEAKSILMQGMQRNGQTNEGGACFLVAEGERVEGFILGVLQRLYHVHKELTAQDLFLVATKQVEPRDPARLIAGFRKWAFANPRVVQVEIGATGVISDFRVTGRWLQRQGMQAYGGIYRQEKP